VVRSPDFLQALNQRDCACNCACNIDPPASSYAIMRRAGPYRGENSGPGKDDRGELDTETRHRDAFAFCPSKDIYPFGGRSNAPQPRHQT
jgi:hypothetical protein